MLENVLSRLQFSLSKNSHSKESGKPFSEISVQLKLQSHKVLGPDRCFHAFQSTVHFSNTVSFLIQSGFRDLRNYCRFNDGPSFTPMT